MILSSSKEVRNMKWAISILMLCCLAPIGVVSGAEIAANQIGAVEAIVNETPTHIDLCAGFGGFSIAAEWAGFSTIGFAENADYPSRIIAQNWPSVPNWGDVRNTPAVPCNLLTAGDPCQPFSIAGRGLGEADDRYLWPAVLDAIGRHNPDWCVLENVVAIKGMVLARRFDDMAARGYQSAAFDIPSCGVGLPSVERHIWIVAARSSLRLEGCAGALTPEQSEQGAIQQQQRSLHATTAGERARRYLSDARTLRSRKGVPYFRQRIEGIGNAVPPPVAFEILQTIRRLICQ